jgi:tetratricopeptide (TPR) repeat protein
MNLLQGIQLHELIMMILGFILGLTLIFIFLYTALKSKPNLKLLYGFAVPVLMIGYPSFKSNQFGQKVDKLDVLVQEVKKDPTNVAAQTALVENLRELPASRCKTSVDAMTTIAQAQASLGLYDSAKVTIKKAIALDNNSPKATQTQIDIEEKWRTREDFKQHIGQIDDNVKRIEQNPKNRLLRDTLVMQLEALDKIGGKEVVHLDNQDVLKLARANAVAGQSAVAEQITDEVLKVNPNQKEAVNLKKDIQDKVIDRKYRPQNKPKPIDKNNNRTKPAQVDEARRANVPETVPAPVPPYSDTANHMKFRVIPKTEMSVKIWNPKG